MPRLRHGGTPLRLFGEMLDKVTGPYLVALKDIPAGTILWKEDPLVAAPSNPEMFAGKQAKLIQ